VGTDGTVFAGLGSSLQVYALSGATGTTLWSVTYYYDPSVESPRVCTGPTLDSRGRVFAIDEEAVIAIDGRTGTPLWRSSVAGGGDDFALTIGPDGLVLAQTIAQYPGMGDADCLVALNGTSGAAVWQYCGPYNGSLWIQTAPAVDAWGRVVFSSAGTYAGSLLFSINGTTGQQLWNTSESFCPYFGTVSLGPDGVVLGACGKPSLCAFDGSTGVQLWCSGTDLSGYYPTIGPDGSVFVVGEFKRTTPWIVDDVA
jgi:outer membrane protein assembly factor BamB